MENGGPAFPTTEQLSDGNGGHYPHVYWGMSLRDWFAGQALTGISVLLGSTVIVAKGSGVDVSSLCDVEKIVNQAYAIADAMLAEREPQRKE